VTRPPPMIGPRRSAYEASYLNSPRLFPVLGAAERGGPRSVAPRPFAVERFTSAFSPQ